jgi:hypothetical protein
MKTLQCAFGIVAVHERRYLDPLDPSGSSGEIRILRRGLAADEQGGDPGYGSNSNQEICDGAEDVIPTTKRFQRHSPTTILKADFKADFAGKPGNSREG